MSIILFSSIVGAPVGIATSGIIKKLLSITRNKKKRHDKILMLAESKLNSIEKVQTQDSVLDYWIDLYFLKHKLAIEADELGHTDSNLSMKLKDKKR